MMMMKKNIGASQPSISGIFVPPNKSCQKMRKVEKKKKKRKNKTVCTVKHLNTSLCEQ